MSSAEPATALPEFSLSAPAAGLTLTVAPAQKQYKFGERIEIEATITNTSAQTKPVAWDPAWPRFLLAKGDTIPAGDWMGCTGAHLWIGEPILIKSAKVPGKGYTLYLPPKGQLVFRVQVMDAKEPGSFRGRLQIDPLPAPTGGPFVQGRSPEDRWLFSGVFEYEVVPEAK